MNGKEGTRTGVVASAIAHLDHMVLMSGESEMGKVNGESGFVSRPLVFSKGQKLPRNILVIMKNLQAVLWRHPFLVVDHDPKVLSVVIAL